MNHEIKLFKLMKKNINQINKIKIKFGDSVEPY